MAIMVWPVMMAASAMGAKKTGFGSCFLALIVATILHGFGTLFPGIGSIVAFLLGAAGFSIVLGTGFLRGIGISILHVVFLALILLVFFLFGVGITSIF